MTTVNPAEALGPLAQALNADGYELDIEVTSDQAIRLDVRATENACEECLVPKDLFASMAQKRLSDASGQDWTVEVSYPVDSH